MADSKPEYKSVMGEVQQFPEREVITERDFQGQTMREFTIKTYTKGNLIRISVWPEVEEFTLERGSVVAANGQIRTNEKNGTTYHNMTTSAITILGHPLEKDSTQKEVVNKKKSSDADEDVF